MNSSTNKALKDAFSEYRSDPSRRFHVKIRRERARQLRELLSEPDTVDLTTFNNDVWIWSSGVYLNGKKIKPAAFDNADQEQVAQYESALDSGELELHGNLIWSPPTRIYGAMLGVDDEQKTETVRAALRFLNDAELSPAQKTRRVQTVAGFGPATATGLVMIFHPRGASRSALGSCRGRIHSPIRAGRPARTGLLRPLCCRPTRRTPSE